VVTVPNSVRVEVAVRGPTLWCVLGFRAVIPASKAGLKGGGGCGFGLVLQLGRWRKLCVTKR